MIRSLKPSKTVHQFEAPNYRLYLPEIVENHACRRHDAFLGEPCFQFEAAESSSVHIGICNSRAKAAGMNGEINPSSLVGRPQQMRRPRD